MDIKISESISHYTLEFEELRKDFGSMSLVSKVATFIFSSVAFVVSLPLLGVAGYVVFRALVGRLKPIHESENSDIQSIEKVASGILKNSGTNKSTPLGGPLDVSVVSHLVAGLENELNRIQSYVEAEELKNSVNRARSSEGWMEKKVCLEELSAVHSSYHYQIAESIQTVNGLVKQLQGQNEQEGLKDRLVTLNNNYSAIGKELHNVFLVEKENIAKIYLELDEVIKKTIDKELPGAEECILEDYDKICVFMKSVFSAIKTDLTEIESEKPSYGDLLEKVENFQEKISEELNKRQVGREKVQVSFLAEIIDEKTQSTTSSESNDLREIGRNAPVGLKNFGNTCFMNSSLQVLLNTKLSDLIDRDIPEPKWGDFSNNDYNEELLTQQLSSIEDQGLRNAVYAYKSARDSYPKRVANLEALRILKEVYEGRNTQRRLEDALINFRRVVTDPVTQLSPLPNTFEQQDPAELLIGVLEGIGYQIQLKKTISGDDQSNITDSVSKLSQKYLSIPIPQQSEENRLTFQSLLDGLHTESVEDADRAWRTTNSEGQVIGCEKYTITYEITNKIPDVLVLQMMRFKSDQYGRGSKIDSPINIDEEVDMRSFIDESLLGEDVSTRYRIAGVINHHGSSIQFGHYTADVLCKEKWNHVSDTRVSKGIKPHNIEKNRSAGYLFVLERI